MNDPRGRKWTGAETVPAFESREDGMNDRLPPNQLDLDSTAQAGGRSAQEKSA